MFLDTHYQYHSKLEDSQQIEDGNWFDKVLCTFKHLIHNYIQDNEENHSRISLKSQSQNYGRRGAEIWRDGKSGRFG